MFHTKIITLQATQKILLHTQQTHGRTDRQTNTDIGMRGRGRERERNQTQQQQITPDKESFAFL